VLLASTSEVYGKLDKPKFSEDDDVILGPTSKARWCYAASKMIDEFLARAYFKEKGLPTVVARLFNTIGPRQTGQYGMVVPRFVVRARPGWLQNPSGNDSLPSLAVDGGEASSDCRRRSLYRHWPEHVGEALLRSCKTGRTLRPSTALSLLWLYGRGSA
jgi:hypothetical protein